MIQMIIIDDEMIIRESLSRFIDWESIGVTVCDTADNGISAMASIVNHKPEIILTDIRMPGLDGLELIRLLREQNLSSEVIFISAYSHFEYARQAIQLGAFDYIIKPINEEELLNTVNRCKTKILEKREKQSIVSAFTENKKERQQQLLSGYLSANRPLSAEEWEFMTGSSEALCVSAIAAGLWDESDAPFSAALLSDILSGEVKDRFAVFSPYPGFCLILFFSDKEEPWSLYHHIQETLSSELFKKENLLITCSLPHPWERNLSVFYTEAGLTYAFYKLKKKSGLYSFNDTFSKAAPGISKNEFIKTYFAAFPKQSDFNQVLNEFLSYYIADQSIYDLGYIKLEFIHLIDTWIEHLRSYNLHDYLKQEVLSAQKTISSQTYIDQLYETVYHLFWNITGFLEEKNMPNYTQMIRNSLAYIHENFDKAITLTDLANELYVSPPYLSKIFSNEVGEPFSKYLLRYRIQKAIEFMKRPEYKLYTIASMCGFSDIAYFSKAFKSVTGMSPHKYRNTNL